MLFTPVVVSKPGPSKGAGNNYIIIRVSGCKEKSGFAHSLSQVTWVDMYSLNNCEEQFNFFFQATISGLSEKCSPQKSVTRHSSEEPGSLIILVM